MKQQTTRRRTAAITTATSCQQEVTMKNCSCYYNVSLLRHLLVVLIGTIISEHTNNTLFVAASVGGGEVNSNHQRLLRTTTCGFITSSTLDRCTTRSRSRLLSRDHDKRQSIQFFHQEKCASSFGYSRQTEIAAVEELSNDKLQSNDVFVMEKQQSPQQPRGNKSHENSRIISRREHLIRAATVTCSSVAFSLGSFVSVAFAADSTTTSNRVNVYPGGNNIKSVRSIGGLPKKIRSICSIMDELQRDLMQERWDLVESYPNQLRSYVPILTQYTDAAFGGDEPAYKGLRVALRYEVGRFFAGVERLKQATTRKDLQSAFLAYAEMALHFDRYLNVGNLYTYQDDTVSYEKFYDGIDNSQLVYEDPRKKGGLAEVRDLILLIEGPDKGKTGIVIGVYPTSVNNNCVVKLDRYKSSSGIREIRVVPRLWAAKRLGEQDPDDVFLIPRPGEPPYNSQQQSASNDNNNNNPFKLVGGSNKTR